MICSWDGLYQCFQWRITRMYPFYGPLPIRGAVLVTGLQMFFIFFFWRKVRKPKNNSLPQASDSSWFSFLEMKLSARIAKPTEWVSDKIVFFSAFGLIYR